MHLEFVRKSPGYKLVLWWGKEGELAVYIGTHLHPWWKPKIYFFRSQE